MEAMDALLLEKLAILASNPICTNHSFLFKLRGKDLPVKDGYLQGGKADPFIQIRKAHGTVKGPGGTSTDFVAPIENKYMGTLNKESLLYNGEKDHCANTLDPVFKTVEIPDVTSICDDGDIRKPILIDIWDYDSGCAHNDFMGYVVISPMEMVEKHVRKEPIPILPGEPGHKWGGSLYVDEIEIALKSSTYWQIIQGFHAEFAKMDINGDGCVESSEILESTRRAGIQAAEAMNSAITSRMGEGGNASEVKRMMSEQFKEQFKEAGAEAIKNFEEEFRSKKVKWEHFRRHRKEHFPGYQASSPSPTPTTNKHPHNYTHTEIRVRARARTHIHTHIVTDPDIHPSLMSLSLALGTHPRALDRPAGAGCGGGASRVRLLAGAGFENPDGAATQGGPGGPRTEVGSVRERGSRIQIQLDPDIAL